MSNSNFTMTVFNGGFQDLSCKGEGGMGQLLPASPGSVESGKLIVWLEDLFNGFGFLRLCQFDCSDLLLFSIFIAGKIDLSKTRATSKQTEANSPYFTLQRCLELAGPGTGAAVKRTSEVML